MVRQNLEGSGTAEDARQVCRRGNRQHTIYVQCHAIALQMTVRHQDDLSAVCACWMIFSRRRLCLFLNNLIVFNLMRFLGLSVFWPLNKWITFNRLDGWWKWNTVKNLFPTIRNAPILINVSLARCRISDERFIWSNNTTKQELLFNIRLKVSILWDGACVRLFSFWVPVSHNSAFISFRCCIDKISIILNFLFLSSAILGQHNSCLMSGKCKQIGNAEWWFEWAWNWLTAISSISINLLFSC